MQKSLQVTYFTQRVPCIVYTVLYTGTVHTVPLKIKQIVISSLHKQFTTKSTEKAKKSLI
jgi:hypothetical protein